MKIDKGVPIPKDERGSEASYPFAYMDAGDSIFSHEKKIVKAALNYSRYRDVKFTTRKVPGGYRVWRIE